MPYRSVEDPAQLRRLLEATLQLEADLDLSILLRHFIEEARSMSDDLKQLDQRVACLNGG